MQKINKTKILKGGLTIIFLTRRDMMGLVKILETIILPSFKESLISFEPSIHFMPFRHRNSKNEYDNHFFYV